MAKLLYLDSRHVYVVYTKFPKHFLIKPDALKSRNHFLINFIDGKTPFRLLGHPEV